ncbi:MAG TPA: nucleotidyltransferase family protein [Thermoanaerobaculia bacterium]|nr:nucleotidyltransferase family protein [Thermoanaerobaculia bacterium]
MKTVAAVLASGSSLRLGQPKQLLEFRGIPLIRHAATVALSAGCDETIVIGSYRDALAGLDVTVLDNAHAAEGMSASIRLAVEHARGARILITLCDQPMIDAEHLRALVATDALIAATAYENTIGVPAVFSPELADELLALRGDAGARAVIQAHPNDVVAVQCEAAAIDIDTMDDYLRLLPLR